jgi:outer membrane receptor protein involved in Fe transport
LPPAAAPAIGSFSTPGGCFSVDSNLNPGPQAGSLDEHNVSWRTGLDWEPNHSSLFYFNVSKGYKAGSAGVLPGLTNFEFLPVTQESILAYEAGFKATVIEHILHVDGAIFYDDYTNKQLIGRAVSFPNIFGAKQALVNVPKSRIEGAEAQVILTPIKGLTLNVGATYIDSKVQGSFINYNLLGVKSDFGGEAFPYTPKWEVVADAEYKFPISERLTAFCGGTITYHSATVAGFAATPYLNIDAYTLIDLRAGVQTNDGRWKLVAFGDNVTDEYYWTNVARISDTIRRLAGMPPTFGARLSWRY